MSNKKERCASDAYKVANIPEKYVWKSHVILKKLVEQVIRHDSEDFVPFWPYIFCIFLTNLLHCFEKSAKGRKIVSWLTKCETASKLSIRRVGRKKANLATNPSKPGDTQKFVRFRRFVKLETSYRRSCRRKILTRQFI